MDEYILEAKKIIFDYLDGTRAIRDLSIKIPKGKKISVIGNNGAGKTTLFLHFNAVNRPQKGEIFYKGKKISYSSKEVKNLRKNIGVVFQDPDNQLFSASVFQDVSYGPINLGWPEEVVRDKIEKAMRMTGTWELRDKPTHFLSYGQKKRVAIAGILVMEPEVIILDEPTAGLDPVYSSQMMQLLDSFNQKGATVILSSHNMDEVFSWADYIFVLHDGEILAEGLPIDVFRNKEILKKANLTKPWTLEVYDKLVLAQKLPQDEEVPRDRGALLKLL